MEESLLSCLFGFRSFQTSESPNRRYNVPAACQGIGMDDNLREVQHVQETVGIPKDGQLPAGFSREIVRQLDGCGWRRFGEGCLKQIKTIFSVFVLELLYVYIYISVYLVVISFHLAISVDELKYGTHCNPIMVSWITMDSLPKNICLSGKIFGLSIISNLGSVFTQARTPWKINMEPINHQFRKENHLPNLHDYVPC